MGKGLCLGLITLWSLNPERPTPGRASPEFLSRTGPHVLSSFAPAVSDPATDGTVSKIMSGARSITVDHAKRLARRFKMRPGAFLDLD
jgi:hypothetical protein